MGKIRKKKMKGYTNLIDIEGAKIEHISLWHEAEFESAPTRNRKNGDKIKYSIQKLIYSNGKKEIVKVAEIIPHSGYYENPYLIKHITKHST